MWYVVWRNQSGEVAGFITDDDDKPKAWKTEKEAERDMKDHILENFSEIIEL